MPAGIIQAGFDPARREIEEELEETHWQVYQVPDLGVQELLCIWRSHRRTDGHIIRNDACAAHTFLGYEQSQYK